MSAFSEQLSQPLSKNFIDSIVLDVENHPVKFAELYQLIYNKDNKIAWRAAWACEKISEKHPDWYSSSQVDEMIAFCFTIKHGGLHRLCLSILYNLPLPAEIPVDFINACFEWMLSPKFPIAVQALSMRVLYKVCLAEPGFIPELVVCLENADPGCYSPGFLSTRKNIIKKLKNNKLTSEGQN